MLGLGKWGWDDTTCVAAFVTLIGQLVMCILEDHWGYYRNYWTLDFDNIPPYLKADFARTVVYAVGLGLCKASIICLYQRIFEGPRLRWMLLLSQIFNAILSLSFVISAFFVAQPFSAQFEVDRPANYVYHDVWDGTGAFSTVNAAWDIWLIAIPAVVVCQLRMKTERKLNVIGVSATGIMYVLITTLEENVLIDHSQHMCLRHPPLCYLPSRSSTDERRRLLPNTYLAGLPRVLRRAMQLLRHRLSPRRAPARRQEAVAGAQDAYRQHQSVVARPRFLQGCELWVGIVAAGARAQRTTAEGFEARVVGKSELSGGLGGDAVAARYLITAAG